MRIGVVHSMASSVTPLKRSAEVGSNVVTNSIINKKASDSLPSLPTLSALSQMPNVNFGSRYNYGDDDLSPYSNYIGPQPPEIEIRKYNISKKVEADIRNEDYLSAIKGKLELAKICRLQDKEDDAYNLEESIRRLYKDLPKYQRPDAKEQIASYNEDMAYYIDEDIKRY